MGIKIPRFLMLAQNGSKSSRGLAGIPPACGCAVCAESATITMGPICRPTFLFTALSFGFFMCDSFRLGVEQGVELRVRGNEHQMGSVGVVCCGEIPPEGVVVSCSPSSG